MTRDEIKAALEAGKSIHFHSWTWTADAHGNYIRCCDSEDNCCYEALRDMQDMLDDIEAYAPRSRGSRVDVL